MKKFAFILASALALGIMSPAPAAAQMDSQYPDFTYAAENAVEAVVYVEVTQVSNSQTYQIDDPFFRFFFGDEYRTPNRERKGSGSGVIISEDGYIVTNCHVVSGASKIRVTLNNDAEYDAEIIGSDPVTDVALVKINAKGLKKLDFADSDKLRLGEWVLAIGSPLGIQLRSTITAGIVSAKGRSIPDGSGQFKIESFIQTDAAVNPGNSGGALVNRAGKLVGINTAIVSTTGSYSGYSFAIPSNMVARVVADLKKYGSVRRARLGITMQEIDQKKADELKLSSKDGVYVVEVTNGSAADKAGLKEGDVIVAIDGTSVKGASSVQEKIGSYRPGDTANIKYIRDGKTRTATVRFAEAKEETSVAMNDGTTLFYGARLKVADEKTLSQLRIKSGVEVVSAGNGKFAAAGAEDGLIIRYVNDIPVRTPQDVVEAASKARRAIVVEGVTSSGQSVFFALAKE